MVKHRIDIDCLKAIAIISVVLYHMGFIDSGYLGVDLFLVINGFLVIPSLCDKINCGSFRYIDFLHGKYDRLAPLVVLASIICLILGSISMLPDSYEVLSESAFASVLFSSNLLNLITSGNYWDVLNNYNPLLHMWYVGILGQFYVIFPLFLMLLNLISKKFTISFRKIVFASIVILFFCSLSLYFTPPPPHLISDSHKFYGLHCRLFEILAGAISAFIGTRYKIKNNAVINISTVIILFLLFSSIIVQYGKPIEGIESIERGLQDYTSAHFFIPKTYALVLVVFFSSIILLKDNSLYCAALNINWLATIGKCSYSIFIWHQVILGFYRSYISNNLTYYHVLILLILISVISYASYLLIEQRTSKMKYITIFTIISSLVVIVASLAIYKKAGVIRDVPELDITIENAHNGMYGEYCDRVYKLDTSYSGSDKIKCFILGNSFARDFANILLESKYADMLDIQYSYDMNEHIIDRLKVADAIFIYGQKKNIPKFIFEMIDNDKIYGIGTKNFGESNSIIYSKRHKGNYYSLTNCVLPSFIEENEILKRDWGEKYIDLMKYELLNDSECQVFTDDNRFISRDCRHLSKAGAEWYAKVLDFSFLFDNVRYKSKKMIGE